MIQWPKKVTICEVGPRDGLQNEKQMLMVDQKIDLIEGMVDAGVKVIEIGSFVHPKAIPQMADTDEMGKRLPRREGVEYRSLVANLKGVERSLAAGVVKAKLTVSASESHCLANLNKTPEEIIAGFADCVEFAKKNGMELSGAISTAFGCPFDGNVPFEQVEKVVCHFVALGITELSLSDTTGMANPKLVYDLSTHMLSAFPEVKWVLHFHNTRGMALANIVAGMQAGITWFDACFAGMGGCPFAPGASGNVATEDVVHMLHEMGIETGIDLEKVMKIARKAQEYVGRTTDSFVLTAGRCSDIIREKPERQKNA